MKNTLLILFLIVFINTTANAQNPFSDLDGHWSKDFVTKSYSKGIIKGYSDGTFKPDAPVSFAESLSLLTKAGPRANLLEQLNSDHQFDNWYDGLIQMYNSLDKQDEKKFGTHDSITRDIAVYLMLKQLGVEFESGDFNKIPNQFPDVNQNSEFAPYLAFAGYVGISDGYAHNGHFGGDDGLTRGQLAKMSYMTLVENANDIVQKYKDLMGSNAQIADYSDIKVMEAQGDELFKKLDGRGSSEYPQNDGDQYTGLTYNGDFTQSDIAKALVAEGTIEFDEDGDMKLLKKANYRKLSRSDSFKIYMNTTMKVSHELTEADRSKLTSQAEIGSKSYYAWISGETLVNDKTNSKAITTGGEGFSGSLPSYLTGVVDVKMPNTFGFAGKEYLEKNNSNSDILKYLDHEDDRTKEGFGRPNVNIKEATKDFYDLMLHYGYSSKDWKIINGWITYTPSKINHKLMVEEKGSKLKFKSEDYNQDYYYNFRIDQDTLEMYKAGNGAGGIGLKLDKSSYGGGGHEKGRSFGIDTQFHLGIIGKIL